MADEDTNTAADRGDDVNIESPLKDAGAEKDEKLESKEGEGDKLSSEDDETPEEKVEREAREAEEEKKRRIRIPKARFDEAQAKARQREQALLDEIDRIKGGQQASATQKVVTEMKSKIEEMQDKYEDLILDGKKDDARKVRRQIDAMREELSDYHTSVKTDAARRSAVEELTFNAQLANLESKYPALNPDTEDFDEDATGEVAALVKALVASGTKRADALVKAVKYVLGTPPTAKEAAEPDAAKATAQQRAEAARKKAAAADKQQPPSQTGVGLDSDKAGAKNESGVDVVRMSQDKFANLDEETKSRLRGDIL